ncbi:MAG: hypothetical protein V3T58_03030 [Candidatus Hydrothermarchaeales archaeon]
MHFSNYISLNDAKACADSGLKRITVTPTALKQTPKATIEFLKQEGLEIIRKKEKGRPNRLSQLDIRRILAIRRCNLSYYKISNLTGIPKSTAFDYCKRYNCEELGEKELGDIQRQEAMLLLSALLEKDLDEEINSLAMKGLESSDLEEIIDTMRRIEDIINFNSL